MSLAWQFFLAGVGTYLIRLSAIGLAGHGVTLPPRLERTLRLIAPAVLAAIVANGLLLDAGHLSWYVGTLVAVLMIVRLRSAVWSMGGAMFAVWLMQRLGMR